MPTVQVNDIDMFYEVQGEGYPLLLIMGLGANMDWWGQGFIHALAKNYRVIAFDNRGAGRSDAPQGPYSIPQMASDAVGLLDTLEIAKAHVFGCSMGGMIAQELALQHPHRVNKLILGCTASGGKRQVQPSPQALALLASQGDSAEAMKRATTQLLFPPEFVEHNSRFIEENWEQLNHHPMSQSAFMSQLLAIQAWSGSNDKLADVEAPTLVLHGTEDILLPPQNGEFIADQIPGAKLVMFEGCGHAFTAQKPREVLQTVLDFLKP